MPMTDHPALEAVRKNLSAHMQAHMDEMNYMGDAERIERTRHGLEEAVREAHRQAQTIDAISEASGLAPEDVRRIISG